MDNINSVFLSLNQGKQFQQKRNKNNKSNNKSKGKEGFTNSSDFIPESGDSHRIPVFLNQYNRKQGNIGDSTNDVQQLTRLQTEYDNIIQQLDTEKNMAEEQGDAYLNLTSPNNPFLSKNITINGSQGDLPFVSSGVGGYVTAKGMFKNYTDQATFDATAGKNGCPAEIIKGVKKDNYSSLLKKGTDMKSGQSCGNEGKNVYVSRVLTNPEVTYQKCYYNTDPNDTTTTSSPALTLLTDQLYTFDECKQKAVDSGQSYFSIRGKPDANYKSSCLIGNTNDPTIYGSSTTIITPVKLWSTQGMLDDAGSVNALWNGKVMLNKFGQLVFSDSNNVEQTFSIGNNKSTCTDADNCSYYIVLQNDGNMCCYKGTDPSNNQSAALWCSDTNGKQQAVNPDWISSYAKPYGKSYLSTGQYLTRGQWIGSEDGKLKLIYENETGNLVLYTSATTNGCAEFTTPSQKFFYGDTDNTNALYKINEEGVPDNLGNIAYIDNNSTAHMYPMDMLGYSNNYTIYPNFDTVGNDIAVTNSGEIGGIEQCKVACNSNSECAGFVWAPDDTANPCQLKNSNMFPKSPRITNNSRSMYVRRLKILDNGLMCNKEIVDIDTLRYARYDQGSEMTENAIWCRDTVISDAVKARIKDLESRLVVKGQEIAAKIKELFERDRTIFDNMDINNAELKKKILLYKRITMDKNNKNNKQTLNPMPLNSNSNNMKEGMQNLNINDVNGMLADTDIIILQENYSYVLWSVLAVGLLTVTINMMKAKNK